jgi:WD40 repeat protein
MVYRWLTGNGENTFRLLYSGKNEKDGAVELVDVLAVSPDAKWLACGVSNTSIKMIPLDHDGQSYVLSGHRGRIKSLIFSYDGKSLYSAALDGRVLKWDLAARTSKDLTDGSVKITSIDVSSNGKHIAGISSDGKVMIWDPESYSDAFRIEPSGKNIKSIRFNPESNMIAIGDVTGMIEIWDISSRKKISEVKAHDAQVNDIRFNPVLEQMATAGNDSRVRIFNFRNPADLTEPPITFTDNGGFVMVMQFSNDGQLLVSGAYEEPGNLISRPSHADYFTRDICSQLKRNMTTEEWEVYVARDIPPEKTCQDILNIKVSAIK